jgi:hypothetical protein
LFLIAGDELKFTGFGFDLGALAIFQVVLPFFLYTNPVAGVDAVEATSSCCGRRIAAWVDALLWTRCRSFPDKGCPGALSVAAGVIIGTEAADCGWAGCNDDDTVGTFPIVVLGIAVLVVERGTFPGVVGIQGLAGEEKTMDAEALEVVRIGRAILVKDTWAPSGALGKESCSFPLAVRGADLLRECVGETGVLAFVVLLWFEVLPELGRRNQNGSVNGDRLRMRSPVSTLKNSVAPDVSCSSGGGAVAGGTSNSSRVYVWSSGSRSSSAALDASGEATCCVSRTFRASLLVCFFAPPVPLVIVELLPLALASLGLCDILFFVGLFFAHGFFQPSPKGPLKPAERIMGRLPRRICEAIFSIRRRLAACSTGPRRSAGSSSKTSFGST